MKLFFFIFGFLCLYKCSGMPKSHETKINVLIVTDDRKFNREAFFGVFESFQNIHATVISHPEILDLFGTDSIRSFDAFVFYDMPEQVILTDTQKQNFQKFFEEGTP